MSFFNRFLLATSALSVALAASAIVYSAMAQENGPSPITEADMLNPDPADWLMINRTYDEQRYSPLDQINRDNVSDLRLAWSRGLPRGAQETTPIVHDGVMYLVQPGAGILAIDAATGDQVWEYWRDIPRAAQEFVGAPETARNKNIAIFADMIYYPTPDGYLVALSTSDGEVRWETKIFETNGMAEHTGGVLVADGKVITNRTCEQQAGCFISAHDAMTGEEVWKFWNTARPGSDGDASWGSVPGDQRIASSWGLPGSYDPERRMVYWAVSNPKPYTRLSRHFGNIEDVPQVTPADLYSNSTVALDVDTGELKWYYQHVPGDDWDADHLHERTLITTTFDPDPNAVKWINPNIARGEERDAVVAVGEGGGLFVLDRDTGEFMWAMPFPYDVPEFHISDIDVETGRTHINWNNVMKQDGDKVLNCFHNTRSFWSTAYDPTRNALFIPFHDSCLEMTANLSAPSGWGPREGILRPGSDPEKYLSIARVDLSTGEMRILYSQGTPGNGSALVTGGDLLFWGDMGRRFRAFDPDTGEILWEQIVGGIVQTSTITYAVDGKQYVAILTGDGASGTEGPVRLSGVATFRGHNEIYVFALPD
jgi:PQQ-dependent dehydrogenase (methanol/ethanol family)